MPKKALARQLHFLCKRSTMLGMKASKIALLSLATAAIIASCSKSPFSSKGGAKSAGKKVVKSADQFFEGHGSEYASFAAMEEHFSPDFSYKYDGEDEEYIEKEKKASSAKGKSQSAIPGIRELSNYKTKYFERRGRRSSKALHSPRMGASR